MTHEIPTTKNFGQTKYPRERNSDPQNTYKNKSGPSKYPREKGFGLIKYPRQKNSDAGNTQEKNVWTHERHGGSIARDLQDPQNLAHSENINEPSLGGFSRFKS